MFLRGTFEAAAAPDKILWTATKQLLSDRGLLHSKYLVRDTGTRAKRWKGQDRELTPDELAQDLEIGPLDGFLLHTIQGAIPAYCLALYAGKETQENRLFGFGGSQETQSEVVANHSGSFVQMLASNTNLVLAWRSSTNYHGWMNQTDIKQYERLFGSVTGFRTKPFSRPPLDFPVLDISLNPGREEITPHYHRTVAANMWLGPGFWNHAPCTKAELLKEPWVEVEDTEHYLYLKAYPEPFTRPDGEQGRIQRRLWNVLFHQDCEWPPGSGSIAGV
jgi:hypothetical protein